MLPAPLLHTRRTAVWPATKRPLIVYYMDIVAFFLCIFSKLVYYQTGQTIIKLLSNYSYIA